jgi:hypothetical protein
VYPTDTVAPVPITFVEPLDARVIVEVPIVRLGLVNEPEYEPVPVIVVRATLPAFVAVVVAVLYVAPDGTTDTTVTDRAAPLYAEVVAPLILHVTEVIGVDDTGKVITQLPVTAWTPVQVSLTVQKIVVLPATDNEAYVTFVLLLVDAEKVTTDPV